MVSTPEHASSLTLGAFRPVVDSLDLSPLEAGGLPPMPKGVPSLRTQGFIAGSVLVHCVAIACLVAFSTARPEPGLDEIPLEVVVLAPSPAPSVPTAGASRTAATDSATAVIRRVDSAPGWAAFPNSEGRPAGISAPVEPDDRASASPPAASAPPPAAPSPSASTVHTASAKALPQGAALPDTAPAPTLAVETSALQGIPEQSAPAPQASQAGSTEEKGAAAGAPAQVQQAAVPVSRPLVDSAGPVSDVAAPPVAAMTTAEEAATPPLSPPVPTSIPQAQSPEEPAAAEPADAGGPAVAASVPAPADAQPAAQAVPSGAGTASAASNAVLSSGPADGPDLPASLAEGHPAQAEASPSVAIDEPTPPAPSADRNSVDAESSVPADAPFEGVPADVPVPPAERPSAQSLEAQAALDARAEKLRRAEVERAARRAEQARRKAAEAEKAKHVREVAAASRAYRLQLAQRIHDFQKYPETSRANSEQGTVVVSFSVDAGGRITAARVVRSSGYAALDAETIAAIHRASPMPKPPPLAQHSYSAPFSYKLQK